MSEAPLPPEGGFKKNFKTLKTFERFFRNQIPCQRQASSLRFGLPASGGNDSYTFFNSPVDQRHRYNEDEITTDDVDAKNLKASKVGVNPSFDAGVSSTHHADETAMS